MGSILNHLPLSTIGGPFLLGKIQELEAFLWSFWGWGGVSGRDKGSERGVGASA